MTTTTTISPAALEYLREDAAGYAHKITIYSGDARAVERLAAGYVVLAGAPGHDEQILTVTSEDDIRWETLRDYRGIEFRTARQIRTPAGGWATIRAAERASRLARAAEQYADRASEHTGF